MSNKDERQHMRRNLRTVLVVLLAVAGSARADEMTIKGLPYTNVRITDVEECKVFFRTPTGNLAKVPLRDVDSLSVMGMTELNEAEQLVEKGRLAQAVKSYDAAMRRSVKPWMKKLVRHRRMRALERLGWIDRAAEDWLTIVQENGSSAVALRLRPKKLGARGSEVNRQAIEFLELRSRRVSDRAARRAIRELLLDLYRAEGRDEEAVALARELNVSAPSLRPAVRKEAASSRKALQQQLKRAEFLIAKGLAAEALKEIEARLKSYHRSELPEALLLCGKARLALAKPRGVGGKQLRGMLLKAGLDFMRVAVFFPDSPQAAEALFLVAEVNRLIGNVQAARKAYRLVIREYEQSGFAVKARDQLKKLMQR